MAQTTLPARPSFGDRALRPFDATPLAPAWVGVGLALGYMLTHLLFDAVFASTVGFPSYVQPLWSSSLWWVDLVNAALFGYLPAALMTARRGSLRDLEVLRPRLCCGEAELESLGASLRTFQGVPARLLLTASPAVGFAFALVDPSLSANTTQSPDNPLFVWALLRTALFVWLISRLFLAEFQMTRLYWHMGRDLVEVELLDLRSLAPFARKGQRSALIWVLFTSIFSLFWLSDSASSANLPLLFLLIGVVTAAFVLPLVGVRAQIRERKQAELAELRTQIQRERAGLLDAEQRAGAPSSARLANLIGYHQLVDGVREWPVDASNLLRFGLYLMLGLGSWLGGALVERVLSLFLGD